MKLYYHGVNCIEIRTKKANLLIDPYDESHGLGKVKVKNPDIVLSTDTERFPVDDYKKAFQITNPGEYEISGVTVYGIPAKKHTDEDNQKNGIMFRVVYKNVIALITGSIAPKLTDEQREQIDGLDVLAIPVGGHGLVTDSEAAAKITTSLEPAYVIPTHYDDGEAKYPVEQDPVDKFLKEIGNEPTKQKSLKAKSNKLPESIEVILLEKQ